jgi:hypothetical protein
MRQQVFCFRFVRSKFPKWNFLDLYPNTQIYTFSFYFSNMYMKNIHEIVVDLFLTSKYP